MNTLDQVSDYQNESDECFLWQFKYLYHNDDLFKRSKSNETLEDKDFMHKNFKFTLDKAAYYDFAKNYLSSVDRIITIWRQRELSTIKTTSDNKDYNIKRGIELSYDKGFYDYQKQL